MLDNKDRPIVSVIVPYHNSEDFISECIESVLAQTYQNWELILVDDHSVDSSNEICKRYVTNDRRIMTIATEKPGVSAARNAGIDRANGQYIMFVDSDDCVEPKSLESLLDGMSRHSMTVGSYRKMTKSKVIEESILGEDCLSRDGFITALFNSRKVYVGYCWGKLFDLGLIEEKQIRFNTELAYNEDRLFVLQYSMAVDRVIYHENVVYNYRQHDNSVMYNAAKNVEKLSVSIRNEILSADYIREELGTSYPEAAAWLDYNLLKKGYIWKKKLKGRKKVCNEVDALVIGLRKKVWTDKRIDLLSRLKLIKSVLSA